MARNVTENAGSQTFRFDLSLLTLCVLFNVNKKSKSVDLIKCSSTVGGGGHSKVSCATDISLEFVYCCYVVSLFDQQKLECRIILATAITKRTYAAATHREQ